MHHILLTRPGAIIHAPTSGPAGDRREEARRVVRHPIAIPAKARGSVEDGRGRKLGQVAGVRVERPVPVGLRATVPALVAEHGLIGGYEEAVPGQEVADKMHVHGLQHVRVEEVVVAREDAGGGG